MSRSIEVVTGNGQGFFTTPKGKKSLLRSGLAVVASKKPLVLRLKDDRCSEFQEELRHLCGRVIRVTKREPEPRSDRKISYTQDEKGIFRIQSIEKDSITKASHGAKRIRPPRISIPQSEIDFQRHKAGLLRKQSEEEAERVRLRSG